MDEEYNKIGLMQLRIYARNIGIKAPTAYTKTELIEKIRRIEKGIDEPYQSTRGRPTLNETKVPKQVHVIQIKRENIFARSKKELKDKIIKVKTKREVEKKIKEIEEITEEYLKSLHEILER